MNNHSVLKNLTEQASIQNKWNLCVEWTENKS